MRTSDWSTSSAMSGATVGLVEPGRRGDPLGLVQGPAPEEHRQGREQRASLGAQELERPVDGGPQRAVTGRGAGRRRGQQVEATVQAGGHRRGRHRGQAGRGQLDGERQPVQAEDDVAQRGLVGRDPGAGSPGPVDEKLHRGRGTVVRVGAGLAGQAQRIQRQDLLALHPQRGPAGGDDPDLGARRPPGPDQAGHRGPQRVAVVHQQQQADRHAASRAGGVAAGGGP